MKPHKIVCAGFGGQGVLTVGQLLAMMAMERGLQVSWMPSYGPEMRGGTANCHIVIDEQAVGSPLIAEGITHLLAMNQPALDKFAPKLADDGVIIANAPLVNAQTTSHQQLIAHDFLQIANHLGSAKAQNMVALGYVVKALKTFSEAEALAVLLQKFGDKDPKLTQINAQALHHAFEKN
jgi:2-oxoglutarate ferredoxin oxidoreductase subunit gamma